MNIRTLQNDFILLVGRLLLSFMFVISGVNKIMAFTATADYMSAAGLPAASLLLVLTIAVEVLGGLAIAIGWQTRWAALVIFLFLIPVTYVFHAFWNVDPAQAQNQMNHFMKNLTIMGGMLYLLATGPGRISADRR